MILIHTDRTTHRDVYSIHVHGGGGDEVVELCLVPAQLVVAYSESGQFHQILCPLPW